MGKGYREGDGEPARRVVRADEFRARMVREQIARGGGQLGVKSTDTQAPQRPALVHAEAARLRMIERARRG